MKDDEKPSNRSTIFLGLKGKILPLLFGVVVITMIVFSVLYEQKNNNTSDYIKITIPPGLRKEEIADILTASLDWTSIEKNTFMVASTSVDYFEGVYFPDTYLIPRNESPQKVSSRLINNFSDNFMQFQGSTLKKNIKWTSLLTLASIIQREAASSSDMAIISGILWNRLEAGIKLDIDSTVQYARGNTADGWWAPVKVADLKINSPYNTYINKGLPPHPISNPGLDSIYAALNPEKTDCIFYLHDASRAIHCSNTYEGQQINVEKYLK